MVVVLLRLASVQPLEESTRYLNRKVAPAAVAAVAVMLAVAVVPAMESMLTLDTMAAEFPDQAAIDAPQIM